MNLDSEFILNLITKLGKATFMWSLDSNSSKFLKIIHRAIFVFNVINLLIHSSLNSLTLYDAIKEGNYYQIIDSVSHMGTCIEVSCNWFLCKYHRKQFQELFHIARKKAEKKNRPHRKIFQKYLNNYVSIYFFEIILYFGTVIFFMCGPFISEKTLPLLFYFDFHIIKYSYIYYMVYIWHVFIMSLSMTSIVLNLTTAILISAITTKLDGLGIKIKAITNDYQLGICVRKHQKCIRYSQTLNHTFRFMILKVYVTTLTSLTFGALPVLYYQDYYGSVRSLLRFTTCLIMTYILARAAEDMRQAGFNVSQAIYNSDWLNMSPKIRKSMIIMMCRAQKPLDISVSGILPALTLKFYAQFLSFTLSYIMTFRAILL